MRAKIADRRAERLLREHLDDEQRRELETSHYFYVETADGTRRYRINRGFAGNVYLVRDGEREASEGWRLARYCCHIIEDVPQADHMLAQKLMLETAEAEFLRLANVS